MAKDGTLFEVLFFYVVYYNDAKDDSNTIFKNAANDLTFLQVIGMS